MEIVDVRSGEIEGKDGLQSNMDKNSNLHRDNLEKLQYNESVQVLDRNKIEFQLLNTQLQLTLRCREELFSI